VLRSKNWAQTCKGGWSTKRGESSVAITRARSGPLSLLAGTVRVARQGAAGFLPALARDMPVNLTARPGGGACGPQVAVGAHQRLLGAL
jgi:hypothetical protein